MRVRLIVISVDLKAGSPMFISSDLHGLELSKPEVKGSPRETNYAKKH